MHDAAFRPALDIPSTAIETPSPPWLRLFEAIAQVDQPFAQQATHVLRTATDVLQMDVAVLGLLEADRLHVLAVFSPNGALHPEAVVPTDQTYAAWHTSNDEVIAVDDVTTSSRTAHTCFGTPTPNSYIGVRFMEDARHTYVLGFYKAEKRSTVFTRSDVALVQRVRQWAAAALRKQQYDSEREQLIDELHAFSHTVAHDLKAPLSTILGYAHILSSDAETLPATDVQEFGDIILEKGLDMRSLMDALLLLAQVRSTDAHRGVLDMQALVDSACKRLGDLIRSSAATITQPASWPAALGHGPWIETVWVNYISNAIKYGGSSPEVTLGVMPLPHGMTRFWVRDNGLGLTPEQRDQLFTPFTRFAGHTEGHGLGLSIVKRVIERLGGDVGVQSDGLGQGSTFFFTLPTA